MRFLLLGSFFTGFEGSEGSPRVAMQGERGRGAEDFGKQGVVVSLRPPAGRALPREEITAVLARSQQEYSSILDQ